MKIPRWSKLSRKSKILSIMKMSRLTRTIHLFVRTKSIFSYGFIFPYSCSIWCSISMSVIFFMRLKINIIKQTLCSLQVFLPYLIAYYWRDQSCPSIGRDLYDERTNYQLIQPDVLVEVRVRNCWMSGLLVRALFNAQLAADHIPITSFISVNWIKISNQAARSLYGHFSSFFVWVDSN